MTFDVRALPRRTLKPGHRLYRIHRAARDPFHFQGSGLGRFDPIASHRPGASYWAEQLLAAWVEVFRRRMTLSERDVEERRLTTLTLAVPVALIDLTPTRALKAGVTAALTGGADYTESQALADGVQADVDGVRWRVRHDIRGMSTGVALLGPTDFAGPSVETVPMPATLVDDARSTFRYEVLPEPPK